MFTDNTCRKVVDQGTFEKDPVYILEGSLWMDALWMASHGIQQSQGPGGGQVYL